MKPLKNPTVHTAIRAKAQVDEPLCSVGIFKMEKENQLTCNTCKEQKEESSFMRDRSQPKGRNPTCKKCVVIREEKKFEYLEPIYQKMIDELYVDYEGEYWQDMANHEDFYLISNFGRIYSKKGKVRMRPILAHGYLRTNLMINGKRKGHQIHRLVAKTFIKNHENLPFVNHIDSCGINNHVSNLEWCDHSQNMKHSYEKGRIQPRSVPVLAKNIKTGEEISFSSMNKLRIKIRIKTKYVQAVLSGAKESHSGWIFTKV